MKLSDVPSLERPREKLLSLGPSALSDAELLALVLGIGTKGASVVELSQEILARIGGPMGLYSLTFPELYSVKGVGEGKACALLAIGELCARAGRAHYEKLPLKEAIASFRFGPAEVEEVFVYALDGWGRVIAKSLVGKGGPTRAIASSGEILRLALSKGTTRFALVHTHPLGNALPSPSDLSSTRELKAQAEAVGLCLLDHLIVAKTGYFSFRDNGLLDD